MRSILIRVVLALVAVVLIACLIPASPASARAPYGGCKEVVQNGHVYMPSAGARYCRNRGWTVERWIVARPDGRMVYISGPAYARLASGDAYFGRRFTVTMPRDLPIVNKIRRANPRGWFVWSTLTH